VQIPTRRAFVIVAILIALAIASTHIPAVAPSPHSDVSAPPGPSTPNVGIWNDACFASNMTVANPQCAIGGASLGKGSTVTVDVNVTNAPSFNGFEFSLFYDPTNLTLSKVNFNSGTVFDTPFAAANLSQTGYPFVPGIIRMSVVNLNGAYNGGTGILAFFTFNIKGIGASPFTLAAGTSTPAEGGGATQYDWTRLQLGGASIDVSTSDGYFQNTQDNPNKLGPVASFTYSPLKPQKGQNMVFNASASFDPDNPLSTAITRWLWDFGDGIVVNSQSSIQTHSFGSQGSLYTGNFSVLLRVFDSDNNFTGSVTHLVGIIPPPWHEVIVSSVIVSPTLAEAGAKLNVTVIVQNSLKSTFDETYNLSITWGPPTRLLKNYTDQVISHQFGKNSQSFTATLDTTGLSPGTYEVDALAIDPLDNVTTNDSGKAVFTIQLGQTSPLPYIIGGAVAVVAALVVVRFVLKRRRRPPVDE
jgi:hypothetical protein